MKAKISKMIGNSALIVYTDDNGNAQACVADASKLPTQRSGAVFDMSPEVLEEATPYGIDLEVVYPDGISIDLRAMQNKLYHAGVVSLEDLKANPSAISQVLLSMLPVICADMYKSIKIVMEDYNV